MLHVPTLSANLISVKKLIHDLNSHVLFNSSCGIILDQKSGRMIGLAKEMDELYFLDTPRKVPSTLAFMSTTNKTTIWLHHHRLGYPSFGILKHLYPSLFQGFDITDFHCEICEKAKHSRVSFPISNTRCQLPFQLMHSDIWGPSSIANISGSCWFLTITLMIALE